MKQEDYTVAYVRNGEREEFNTRGNLLESAVEEGLTQEYSCRVGMCLACVGRVVDASPSDVREYLENGGDIDTVGDEFGYLDASSGESPVRSSSRALTEQEMRQGYVLTCMSSPVDDAVIEMGEYPPSIENEI
ncbi:MAG: 2Fe-2S iron-sulfur cluster-binding protein [Candidatus Nanohaloarchaea archaeon]|nr:2Fe-2S iron-sulfur cluster-binding protein [Candidatus Nanohaloarchaea archaeon]